MKNKPVRDSSFESPRRISPCGLLYLNPDKKEALVGFFI